MNFLEHIELNPKITMTKGKSYPFVEMADVSTCYRSPNNVETKQFDSGVRFQDGDTVIARITPCLQNGKRFYCQNIGTGFGSTEYLVFRPKDDSVDNKYLYYYMQTDFIKQSMINSMTGATGRQRVNNDVFNDLEVCFPKIDSQRKIGEILASYDDLIENNQKQIKLLEEAAQRLYKEWFVDLRFPGYDTTPIVDGVPVGWRKETIGGICSIKKDVVTTDQIPRGMPYIGLEHIPRIDFCLSSWGNAEDVTSNKFKYDADDIIFGKIRPYFHKVGFALNNGVVSTDSFVIRAKDGVWGILLMTVFDKAFVDYTYQTCKEGAKMPRADWRQMEKYEVLIPDDAVRQAFEENIWSITRRIKTVAFQNHGLSEARDRLLPKLMSGEIEV